MSQHTEPSPALLDALHRAEEIASCLEGVNDLLCPDPQIEARQRSNISMLLGLLLEQQNAALSALRAEMFRGRQ